MVNAFTFYSRFVLVIISSLPVETKQDAELGDDGRYLHDALISNINLSSPYNRYFRCL